MTIFIQEQEQQQKKTVLRQLQSVENTTLQRVSCGALSQNTRVLTNWHVCDVLAKNNLKHAFDVLAGCEYNFENLKLSRDHHENCKTHPKDMNIFIYLCFQ